VVASCVILREARPHETARVGKWDTFVRAKDWWRF